MPPSEATLSRLHADHAVSVYRFAWSVTKDESLAHKPRFAPSKPFLALLAAAWTAIITLQLLTPTPENASQTQITPVFTPNSLFALHQHPDLLTP